MNVRISGVKIARVATALPAEIEDLAELDIAFGAAEVRRIIQTNGIARLRKAPPELCASDLCQAAAGLLIDDALRARIEGIVFVSQTPDHILPATACLLQHKLALPQAHLCIDINQGCAGYIYGLYQAALMVAGGGCRAVLLCAGDVLSRFANPLDKSERMVFGDAGSATLVTQGDGQLSFSFFTEGDGAEHLIIPAGGCRMPLGEETSTVSMHPDGGMRSHEDLFMNGIEVMNFSVRQVPRTIAALLSTAGWSKEQVTLFALHQANKFMLDYLRKILKVPAEKLPVSMADTGNTSAASIPLMLCLEHARLEAAGMLAKSVLCGFGVGLSCAAASADLAATLFYPPRDVI